MDSYDAIAPQIQAQLRAEEQFLLGRIKEDMPRLMVRVQQEHDMYKENSREMVSLGLPRYDGLNYSSFGRESVELVKGWFEFYLGIVYPSVQLSVVIHEWMDDLWDDGTMYDVRVQFPYDAAVEQRRQELKSERRKYISNVPLGLF